MCGCFVSGTRGKITSDFLIRKTLLPYKEDTARVLHVGVMKLTGGEKTLVSSL